MEKEELIWRNLKIADDMLDLPLFMAAATSWLKFTNKTLVSLELELRKRNFNTIICAVNMNLDSNYYLLKIVESDPDPIFRYIYICKPQPFSTLEILQHSSSYEENLQKLEYCGHLAIINPQLLKKNKNTTIFSHQSKNK